MENILNVKNRRELPRSGMISVGICVPIKFRFNGLNDVCGIVNCSMAVVFVVGFNEDLLLISSPIDNFCDKAERKIRKIHRILLWKK